MAWRRQAQQHRSRRRLGCLDERLLKDIGISPAQARREASKPFWRRDTRDDRTTRYGGFMPSSLLRYHLMDVFTATPLSGNPLAVFLEAEGLEPATMQAIASELNLSETVFIGERGGSQRLPIRIFTPARELPFAGHPIVGAANLLAAQGLVDRSQPLILEALAGPLMVRFEGDLACFAAAMPAECRASSLGRSAAAELFGLGGYR